VLTAMQLRAAFVEGACGAIAFAWTDEWWRGGHSVDDWAFGLVDGGRRPKPALGAVADVFANVPFPGGVRQTWPKVSVVVCAYNAADTIDECLTSLERLTYPDFEVIVVNDGSRDGTGHIARRHVSVTVIDVANGGLSVARNIGLGIATGDIVAYTDADVRVDPDWLTYLIQPFLTSDVDAAGGPNVVPPDNRWIAQCVARAPGGPTHVLLDDRTAEHVPGCNMAFRRDALLAIGGFNPIYLRAGDDVDACWRVQARGGKIGFAAAALVWHHHRPTVRAYWRQQVGYGEGQAWLIPHHPNKFRGHTIAWRGSIYSPLPFVKSLSRSRVNTGVWGTAAFPSVYQTHGSPLAVLPHMAQWQVGSLIFILFGLLVAVATGHAEGTFVATAGLAGLLVTATRCVHHALASDIESLPPIGRCSRRASRATYRVLIAWLHFIQPFALASGRLRGMLSPPHLAPPNWRRTAESHLPSAADLRRTVSLLARRVIESQFWSERWISTEVLLTNMADKLRGSAVTGSLEIDDGWQADRDMGIAIGVLGQLDLRVLVEEHEGGRCLIRVGQRVRSNPPLLVAALLASSAPWLVNAYGGALTASWTPGIALSGVALSLVLAILWRTARTVAAVRSATAELATDLEMQPIAVQSTSSDARSHTHDGRADDTRASNAREANVPVSLNVVASPFADTEM
jgi:GT2 family glycosyltransferase